MGVTRQYIYKLVKESKLRASRISGKKSLIRRADIELMMKTKPYERIMPKEDFNITEYYTAEEIAEKYKQCPMGLDLYAAAQSSENAHPPVQLLQQET